MFIETLQAWTNEHRTALEAAGVAVSLSEPGTTVKPSQSQWLTLRMQEREVEVGVWVSGECEAAQSIGTTETEATHYDFELPAELVAVLDRLSVSLLSNEP